jgi:hypothetical protein
MKHFINVTTIAELKNQYKKLAFKNHPDRGGDTETMQQINAEYDALLKSIIAGSAASDYSTEDKKTFWESKEEHSEVEKKVKEALDKIIHLEGLEIEIIGVWIWVSGDTKPHKETLKEAGFKWNKTMVKWVFIGKKSNGRGTMTLDEMREKHGSEKVKQKTVKKIAC